MLFRSIVNELHGEKIYNINGVNKNTVGIHTDTGLHNFRRNAVRRMLETNSMNIVISGRTNINAGMVINLDFRQPIPGGDGVEKEIIQNGFTQLKMIMIYFLSNILEKEVILINKNYLD